MQIWVRERTDFIATTERRLGRAVWLLEAGCVGAFVVAVAALGLMVLIALSILSLEIYYGAPGAPVVPDGLNAQISFAGNALLVGVACAVVAIGFQLAALVPVLALHRETVPLKYSRPGCVKEITLPDGDTR